MDPYRKISFQASEATVKALFRAGVLDNLSETDVLNRAVQLYAVYAEGRDAGRRLAEILPDGSVESLTLE